MNTRTMDFSEEFFTHTISHVNPQIIQQYDSPHQFEPLMPAEPMLAPLLEKAGDLMRKATALGAASGKTAQTELRKLLRSMNSYYTNRIEGEHARPSDIERALQQAGGEYKMQFTSPLTRLMQLGEVTSMREWFADLIPAADVRPDVLDNIDFDEFARLSARRRGVDPKVVVDKDAREQIRLARTQQAQQQQLLENAGPLAGALKDVAQARSTHSV